MKSLNKVNLIGNLGNDPDIRTMPNGNKVANISIATTYSYKDGDDWQEKTEWHKAVMFNQKAEVADKYLKKGSKIFVDGRLQTRSWEDPKGGGKRYSTEIVVNDMIMLSKEEMKAPQAEQPAQQPTNFDNFDDEIPF